MEEEEGGARERERRTHTSTHAEINTHIYKHAHILYKERKMEGDNQASHKEQGRRKQEGWRLGVKGVW